MITRNKHIDLCTPVDKIEFGHGNNIRIQNAFRFYGNKPFSTCAK